MDIPIGPCVLEEAPPRFGWKFTPKTLRKWTQSVNNASPVATLLEVGIDELSEPAK